MIYTDMNDIPDASFGLILADCPWGFVNYSKKRVVPQRKPGQHYKTMTVAEMAAMPVNRIMAKDSAMVMWVISSHVPMAFEIAAAWGLTPVSLGLIWCKELLGRERDQFGMFPPEPKFRMSMGYYFRQEAEITLVFKKGKPKRLHKGVRQLIVEPRRGHSEKPEAAYTRCADLFGGPFLDMFSRRERAGWSQFGDEVTALNGEVIRPRDPS